MAASGAQVTMVQLDAAAAAYRVSLIAPWIENLKAWGMLSGLSLFLIPVTVPLMSK
jgi:hypothetical protein